MARRQNGRPLWLPTKEEFILSTAVISTSCSCLQPAAAPGSCCHCGWGSACSNVRTGARVPRAAPAAAAVHCLQHNSPLNPAPCRYRCTGTRRQSCQQLHADTGLLLEPSGWAASLRRAEGWGRGRRSLPRARMGVLPNADRREGESVLQHHPRPAPAASGPTPCSAAPRRPPRAHRAAVPGPRLPRPPVRRDARRGGGRSPALLAPSCAPLCSPAPPGSRPSGPAAPRPARGSARPRPGPHLPPANKSPARPQRARRGGSALPGAAEPGEGTAGGRGGRRAGARGRARRRRGPGRAPPQPPPRAREGLSPAEPRDRRCLPPYPLRAASGASPCATSEPEARRASLQRGGCRPVLRARRALPCCLCRAGGRGPSREARANV